MGNNMLHNYEPLKLGNIAINTFKTFVFVLQRENTKHQARKIHWLPGNNINNKDN